MQGLASWPPSLATPCCNALSEQLGAGCRVCCSSCIASRGFTLCNTYFPFCKCSPAHTAHPGRRWHFPHVLCRLLLGGIQYWLLGICTMCVLHLTQAYQGLTDTQWTSLVQANIS
jgi:hypothetical protein